MNCEQLESECAISASPTLLAEPSAWGEPRCNSAYVDTGSRISDSRVLCTLMYRHWVTYIADCPSSAA